MFWVKPKGYWYARYVLSQVQGISRVGLRCLSLFTSNPCPLFPRTLKKMTITVLAWSLRKVKHFPFFLVSLIMLFWFNLPAVRHGGPGWLRDHLGRDKRQTSQALRKPGRQGRPGGDFKTQVDNVVKLGAQTFILILYFHNDLVEIDPHRLPTRFWRSTGSLCITRLTRKWSTTYTM